MPATPVPIDERLVHLWLFLSLRLCLSNQSLIHFPLQKKQMQQYGTKKPQLIRTAAFLEVSSGFEPLYEVLQTSA